VSLFLTGIFVIPPLLALLIDPSPNVHRSVAEARTQHCRRMSHRAAYETFPGQVSEPEPRGDYFDTDAIVCEARMLPARADEPSLSHMHQSVAELTQMARGLQQATWRVEAFHTDDALAAKIAFAAKVALVEQGERVSDRAPTLAAEDVLVLARMDALTAYPVACARYRDHRSIGAGEALLMILQLDPRETTLHGAICNPDGGFRWLW
jgi:hypothetical protein